MRANPGKARHRSRGEAHHTTASGVEAALNKSPGAFSRLASHPQSSRYYQEFTQGTDIDHGLLSDSHVRQVVIGIVLALPCPLLHTNTPLARSRNFTLFSLAALGSSYFMIKSKTLAEKQRVVGDYSVTVDRSGKLATFAAS